MSNFKRMRLVPEITSNKKNELKMYSVMRLQQINVK